MRFATGLALLLTLAAGTARAEEMAPADRCVGPRIVLEPPLDHRRSWTRAAGETRRRVAELSDVDACTRLEIEATEASVQVRASAADGRSVVREVSKPSELEATVVALLVLPPSEREETLAKATGAEANTPLATPVSDASPKPRAAAEKPEPPSPKLEPRDDRTRAALLPSSEVARRHPLELALAGSGRSTGYLVGAGVGGIVDWNLGGWLVGAAVHGEQLAGPSDVAGRFGVERNASVGALFGRRLVWHPFYLDVAVEAPVLAIHSGKWTSHSIGGSSAENESDDVPGTSDDDDVPPTTTTRTQSTPPGLDLRAGGLVRGVVPLAGHFGATLAADGERSLGLSTVRSVSGQPASLPWNFGLSLGLFWSGG